MKIAICTLAINDWYFDIVRYCVKTIENYAKLHKYDFFICNDIYDGKRDYPWYKILGIQKILVQYDYVVWIDADCHVMRPELSVDYFMNNYMYNYDLLCTKDWNCTLNTGMMILRNTPFVHALLELVWTNKEPFDEKFHEQASMGQIYDSNRLESRSKIRVLPIEEQHVFYSYWTNYRPNRSFLFHAARCSHDPLGFIYTVDCYCPIPMDEDEPGEFTKRLEWLNDEAEIIKDIEDCIKTGNRFNKSSRCKLYDQKFYCENMMEKIAKTKFQK